MFELFLAGKTCEDIRRLNPGFSLGQIVDARLRGEWDRRRDEHLGQLLDGARSRIAQVTLETSIALCDILAAKNKIYQDKVLKYLQTGDEEHIRDLGIGGIDGYRKLVEVLQKLTGQENTKTVKGEVKVTHQEGPRTTTPQQAEVIVEALLGQ